MNLLAISVVGIVVILIIGFVVLGLGRMAWSIVHGDREFEAGGSMGDQMTGPLDDDRDT